MERKLKPEAKYCVNSKLSFLDIVRAYKVGSTITGKVIDYNVDNEILVVDLGNGHQGILPWEEVCIYDFTYAIVSEVEKIPRQILVILYKTVRVKVIEINEGNIVLSRKKNMLEAVEKISSSGETIFKGVVVGKYKDGVFFDIAEGITAFCHITQYSKTFIENIGAWLSLGEEELVELTQINNVNNYRYQCSRKIAGSSANDYKKYKEGQIIMVKVSKPVYNKDKLTGYFVEVSPNVSGIADVLDERHTFRFGDEVIAVIKSINHKEKKMKLKIIVA